MSNHLSNPKNPVQRKQLGEQVFETIRDRIVAGHIDSGQWLRQEELAAEFGVSHTPVRQALERLIAEGLAERVPYKGVRVTKFTNEEIAEIVALRLVFEPLLVRLAVPQLSAEKDELRALYNFVDQAGSLIMLSQMSDRRHLNRRFHLTLAEKSGNVSLTWLYEMIFNKFPDWVLYEGMFRQQEFLQSRLDIEIEGHRAILDAIAASDAELAGQRSLVHLRETVRDELVELVGIPLELLEEKEKELQRMQFDLNS